MNDSYLRKLNDLESLCEAAINLSNSTQGREVDTWREEYASYIFSKVCLTTISILKLLPKSSYTKINNFDVWDISSVCTLVRSLIETFFIFYYVAIDEADKDELDFRFIIWHYHEKCERIKMLEWIGSNNHQQIEELKSRKNKLREDLSKNTFFQRLKSENHKDLKNISEGKIGIFLSNSTISKRAGISLNYYKAVYKYLSNYTHTHPLSVSVLFKFNAEEDESKMLFKVAIDYCTGFLSLAIRNFVRIFPDQILPEEINDLISDWEYIVKNVC